MQNNVCKCFATKHPLVASCSECGFICCEKDKHRVGVASRNPCPSCGTGTLRPPMTKDMAAAAHYDSATVRAYSQKDKLLLFDREHAKRTHVHDAQADYYESSAWLTAEEKKQIDDKLRKKKELRERRPTTKRITLDLAGRKIVEYIRKEDDDEDDILESHGQLNPSSSQIEEHHVYANDELEGRGSRAGEVYRMMREKWELKGK